MNRYESAKEIYQKLGVDTEKVLEAIKNFPISVHCWQGDDIHGFEPSGGGASGGILTTGNYPGCARTPEELMADFDKVLELTPGVKRFALHASYGVGIVDRKDVKPECFKVWVDYAKSRNIKLDLNATFFSHPMVKDGLTLSSTDEKVRQYWIEHSINCLKLGEYFASELNDVCYVNFWTPDGLKDYPADRIGPRKRMMEAYDKIFAYPYDKTKVIPTLEPKLFGIGLEAYTVGSAEFCQQYALSRGIMPLVDDGHLHPTEVASDKISSLLLFNDRMMIHVTRGMRWDSDHVVSFDDETKEIMKEIVRCGLDKVVVATDYFDASINRVSAWITGVRNTQKALLYALLEPKDDLKKLQDEADFTSLQVKLEELKTLPFADVWNEWLQRENVKADYLTEVKKYEKEVLLKR